ncbi:hypothetical protein BV25DRAFT_1871819 [Artomyces pyxidatus]|uniref:Uncharacterized protein n=1 Tax=Artomyces pyxidatus TaxID=48021 RepID=A0ACB8SQV4_9AGAM|nr:hypothetical protein BV25DRAFT_1871819 [Artomyces pyxidatus]
MKQKSSLYPMVDQEMLKELDLLATSCDPATFGLKHEDVLDETYRKAGKMDTDAFPTSIVPERTALMDVIRRDLVGGGQADTEQAVNAEFYKLNVYGKGSFFKAHQDTPRGTSMFGSLVLTFPTPHAGGALAIRHWGAEWNVDAAQLLAAAPAHSIAYAAFFSDVEHEVALVESGHRVTLTYNLYFGAMYPLRSAATAPAAAPFKKALAFRLRHAYAIRAGAEDLHEVQRALKDSDAVVSDVCVELGVEPTLFLIYQDESMDFALMVDRPPASELDVEKPADDIQQYLQRSTDVIKINLPNSVRYAEGRRDREYVNWVTEPSSRTRYEGQLRAYGNNAYVSAIYGEVCIAVRIGKVNEGRRLPPEENEEAIKRRERCDMDSE